MAETYARSRQRPAPSPSAQPQPLTVLVIMMLMMPFLPPEKLDRFRLKDIRRPSQGVRLPQGLAAKVV